MSLSQKKQIRLEWKQNYPRDLSWKREASAKVVAHILASDVFKNAERIALYATMPWEIDVSAIWQARPNACAFPKVANDTMDFFIIPSLLNLKPGYAGILEPQGEGIVKIDDWKKTDLFLIAGYAFDLTGTRIGGGKGFYDKYLSKLAVQPIKWGVAFQTQIAKAPLIREAHDIPMNALCTEKGITVVSG